MSEILERYQKESECFDSIATERRSNNQLPDLRAEFKNDYFYNNIWRDSRFLKAEYGPICQWMVDALKATEIDKVLELGCGNGFLSLELARHKFRVTALDLSEKSIKIAKEYSESINESLDLNFVCSNIADFKEYSGESIVCFGFLHHLPQDLLKESLARLYERMNVGSVLLIAEPRYDHVNVEMATLIYALRLAFPNHFAYENPKEAHPSIHEIYEELGELNQEQSEMDNESPSDFIVQSVQETFTDVKLDYTTSFYDKIIGSIRTSENDLSEISYLLKRLDQLIVKYNDNLARTVLIQAKKV